jgi:hypothetical protein
VDFTDFAGHTLILYNDAPTAFPALVPQYDYYTGAPDRTGIGGYVTIPPGVGPNVRTVMQITVAGPPNSGPATPDSTGTVNLATLQTAFASDATTPGVFASAQDPIVVGQAAYGTGGNSAYNVAYPSTYPNWGISRILDGAISFAKVDGTIVSNFTMKPKAIHDEMGASFDDYGRMSAKLGLEMPFTNAAIANFILQNFVDPATETVRPDEIQIWRITHNGVDTHPIHFHLFDVQVLNRVGWDGFIRLPDDNELGWKDTVRISPLEDTIVALRPVKPQVPFVLPNSLRPLNPAAPLGSIMGFSQIDPTDGGNLVPPTINRIVNFGHEYTWHCHILSHEENDMMRPVIFNVDQLLYTAFAGNGIWQWDMTAGTQLSANTPQSMAASGSSLYGAFAGNGIWKWNGTAWSQITPGNPQSMAAAGSLLYAAFAGNGIWKWDGTTWSQATPGTPQSMAASGSLLYGAFTGNGIWKWDGTTWSQVAPNDPQFMTASGSLVYGAFTGNGIWRFDGTTWSQVTPNNPQLMAGSGLQLYGSFSGTGIWKWDGTTWSQISPNNPQSMTASGSVLYADFAGTGISVWDGIAWTPVTPTDPAIMVAAY